MKIVKIPRKPKVVERLPTVLKLLNKRDKQGLAKRMRENPTSTEQIMIDLLQENKIPFKSQVVIFGYIVDFYFKSAKSILEVDGGIHNNRQEYDGFRDKVFQDNGFRVLRINDTRLINDPAGVLTELQAYLKRGRAKKQQESNKRKKVGIVKRWQDVPKLTKNHLPRI